ncbi:hypothetical protein G7Y79_00056g090440 [Physcia stellaris]|nr:hypothetical protein G7Y79_00056g090440 [Physcia stellaris]
MDQSPPLVFYDIASGPPVRTYAPNPWKTRLALNFKTANYQTRWVELPEITSIRQELGAAPVRTLPDGSPFYTLPIIKNPSTGEVIGDSFEIALYLDKLLPSAPPLFPPSTVGLQKAFNTQVDAIFTNHVLLSTHGMPLNPANAHITQKTWMDRFGAKSWDDFAAALGELATVYGLTEGVWLEGERPCYADLIVGGWLGMLKETTPEWRDVRTWHGGFLGRLDEALGRYAVVR